jgi:hypothetical protein
MIRLLLLLLISGAAHAGPFHAEQLEGLYVLAIGRAQLGVPERPPQVYRVSKSVLQTIACRRPCEARAVQIADAVFYRDDMNPNDTIDASILAHEFVHYLQWIKHGPVDDGDCLGKAARERQAYQVQRELLERAGIEMPRPQIVGCL